MGKKYSCNKYKREKSFRTAKVDKSNPKNFLVENRNN